MCQFESETRLGGAEDRVLAARSPAIQEGMVFVCRSILRTVFMLEMFLKCY